MSRRADPIAADNPFSSRYVRPGSLVFRFSRGENTDTCIARLAEGGWRGAIVGPHGSGKSTLLATLIEALRQRGCHIRLIELRDGQRRLPREARGMLNIGRPGLLALDGYEQLSHWARWRLDAACRRRRCGLLVTSHGPVGLTEICRVRAEPNVVRTLVGELQAGRPPFVDEADVDQALQRHGQNVRETFFELYDLYETRRRECETGGAPDWIDDAD